MTYPTKKLGEICEILDSKRRPVTKSDRKSGPYPYYGSTGVQDYVADYIFDEPLVLVGEDGANWEVGANSAYKVHGKYWVNNHAHVLRPRRAVVLDDWLTYFLKISDLMPFLTGTTVKKLNQEKLRAIEIPVPPIAEQRKLVRRIEAQFAKIDEVARLRAESQALAEKLLPAALHEIFSSAESKGWEEKELEDVSESVADGTHDTPIYHSVGYPLITSKNLRNEGLTFDTAKFISEEDFREINKRSSVKNGDILIGMIGTIGNVTKVNTDEKFSIKNVGLIRPDNKKVLADYIVYFLNNSRLLSLIKTGGSTQKFMSLGMLRKIKIIYPPLAEQKKIVKKLDTLAAKARILRDLQSSQANNLKALKQSILHEVFSN